MSEKKAKTGNIEAKAEAKPVVEAKPAAIEEKPSDIGVFVCN